MGFRKNAEIAVDAGVLLLSASYHRYPRASLSDRGYRRERRFDLRFLTSLVLALAVLSSAHASVTEATLDNGMRVLVKRDARAPIAVSMVWYRIGGSYEEPGSTGLSHVLEHMMFRGIKNTEPGEFSRTISALGGSENAFTSRDYTAYFETLAVEHLDKALELEADRMRNMTLSNDEFVRELEVVKEERRLRTDDKPTGLLYSN